MAHFGNKKWADDDSEPTGAGSFFEQEIAKPTNRSLVETTKRRLDELVRQDIQAIAFDQIKDIESDISIIKELIRKGEWTGENS